MDHRPRHPEPGRGGRAAPHGLRGPSPGPGRRYAAGIDDGSDDRALVDQALAGDARALDRLLRHNYDRLYGLCRRITGNDADAADVAQEALVAIVRGMARGRFDGRSRFGTWAYRVTFNACIDEVRRRQRRPLPAEALPEAPSPSEIGTDELVAGRVDVDAALGRLPPEFRAAVILRDLCGLDYAEIAEVLDIPPGTVRSRIARGRAALTPLLRNPTAEPERPTP